MLSCTFSTEPSDNWDDGLEDKVEELNLEPEPTPPQEETETETEEKPGKAFSGNLAFKNSILNY